MSNSVTIIDPGDNAGHVNVQLRYRFTVKQTECGAWCARVFSGGRDSFAVWEDTREGAIARMEAVIRVRHEVPANG